MGDMFMCLLSCANKGHWEIAKNILDRDPIAKEEAVTHYGLEILSCAAIAGQWEFFNEMVQFTSAQMLTIPFNDNTGETILHRIARCNGSMKSARTLVEKCPSLTQIPNSRGLTPLFDAIRQAMDRELAWYFALVTTDKEPGHPFSGPHAADLLWMLFAVGYYDMAHFLLQKHHHLAQILLTAKSRGGRTALSALASKPFDFPSGTKLGWLARHIYSFVPMDVGHFKPPSHVLQELGGCSSSSTNHQLGKQRSETFVAVDVGHFKPPSRELQELQELGGCSSSSTNHQLGMRQSETAYQWRKFQSLLWNVMEKLVPALQRIRETKFKHECAIKLVYIACKQTKWSLTYSEDPDYLWILGTLQKATALGIVEILSIYMKFFPLPLNSTAHAMLLLAAIENRQDKVFNFLLHKHPKCNVNFIVNEGPVTALYAVAKLRDCPRITSIAGAAFQMQKELQWFKGIETLVSPFFQLTINDEQTPWELFKKEHETMRKEGEEWMKHTANSCMLVATLIATVVFAAAFTVPGGNNQDTGTPVFLQKSTFMLFALFDALALFSSINSLLMFLSILTARFALEDFLETLPKKLIFGLSTLFLAIVSSMIAFGAALSLVLGHRQHEVITLIFLMVFTSAAMFGILQLPLFIQMVRSTYCGKLLGS